MAAATTPIASTSPTIVGSWISETATEKTVITFLNNGTYLLANREGSGGTARAGVQLANYTWDAGSGTMVSSSVTSTGEVGIPAGSNSLQIQADGSLKLTVANDGQVITFRPIVSTAGALVGSWYSDAKDGGSDDVVITFLADGSFVLADKGTPARDPNGTSGVEYGTYSWNASTGAITYAIQTNTDGQWGMSNAGLTRLAISGSVLTLTGADVGPAGAGFIRVSNLQSTTSGTAAADTLTGGTGADTLTGLGGNDSLDGGAGVDTAVYSNARAGYTVTRTATGFTVTNTTGTEGTDTLANVERLKFSDTKLALDTSGNAGTTAKVLGAIFGRAAVANKEYVGIGLSLLDGGTSYESLVQLALASKLGAGATNTAVVNLLYTNLTGAAPGSSELALYKGMLDSGTLTQVNLGVIASEHALNTAGINLVGLAATGIEYS